MRAALALTIAAGACAGSIGDEPNDKTSTTLYEQFYDQADTVATKVFADATLSTRILTCTQPDTTPIDTKCTRDIIAAFGLRAWRRPLEPAEVDRLVRLATDARGLGATFAESIQQVVTAMLAVPQFLYRIELDPDPTSASRHALGP